MARKMVIELPDGSHPVLEQVLADNEHQLQEQLKLHPELLPLDELGLVGPAVVVGRESSVESGKVDLVLLGYGGDLALVEFKTGPQNPDFRECLSQLLDYGSDLWGMSIEDFDVRVARRYFNGSHCPPGSVPPGATLDNVLATVWEPADDAVDWRDRLQAQLRDGTFHYIAVAQRFTPPVLRTLRYLNATMKARFSAVELVRFTSAGGLAAFEARFVEGAEPARTASAAAKAALAGADELLSNVTDDGYRHVLQDVFDDLATMPGLTVFWGTTGCSLRVAIRGRSPLSVGWVFPPGPPRWMSLTDVTLGWYEDANGLVLADTARRALNTYLATLAVLPGATPPKSTAIRGYTFAPTAVIANALPLRDALRAVVSALASV